MSRSFKCDPDSGRKGFDSRRVERNKKNKQKRELAKDTVELDDIDRRKYFRNEESYDGDY